MHVAGRDEEVAILQRILQKEQSEFVAMYGRRRIGKTYLIREVYKSNIIFECSGVNEQEFSQQLENFWLTYIETFPKEQPKLPTTWLQAFSLLKKKINSLKNTEKKVIFLDEIAWFETPKSGFLAALDSFWNSYCTKRNDIILVICGSAASWIINKVINNTGGLHNRVTSHIQLLPFTMHETKAFLQLNKVKLSFKDIAQLYMAVGGVPYYLKDIVQGQSVPQILDNLFFGNQPILKNEFNNLYASLFKNSHLHVAIVKALTSKNKGLTRKQILTTTGLTSGGGFTLLLQELVECGFVKMIQPINTSKDDILYRLMDEYTIFYFKFLAAKKTESSWQQKTLGQPYKIWSGFAFENLCFRHVALIKKALGISGIITNEYSWLQKGSTVTQGAQIDCIIDRNDNCVNIIEAKFYNKKLELTKKNADDLREKVETFKEKTKIKKNVFVTLLTIFGAAKNEHYLSEVTNQLLIDDLFAKA